MVHTEIGSVNSLIISGGKQKANDDHQRANAFRPTTPNSDRRSSDGPPGHAQMSN